MIRIGALVVALLMSFLAACYTVVEEVPPEQPMAYQEPPPPEPQPEPPPPPEPPPEPPPPPPPPEPPPPPPPMAVGEFCMAIATNTCRRLDTCGALPMPFQQCVGEVNGLCSHQAARKGVAAVDRGDVDGCFTAMAGFRCVDFVRAHRRGRVVKACTKRTLRPLFRR